MTTYVDILDTAVKIGLGAAITGIAAYWVTKLKGSQDSTNEAIKYNRALLERISLGVEDSASTLAHIVLLLHRASDTEGDRKVRQVMEARELYIEIYKQVNQTEALATLVGNVQLREKLALYAEVASEFHELVRFRPDEIQDAQSVIDRLDNARDELRDAIRANYDQGVS